jgi:hypothetical protein
MYKYVLISLFSFMIHFNFLLATAGPSITILNELGEGTLAIGLMGKKTQVSAAGDTFYTQKAIIPSGGSHTFTIMANVADFMGGELMAFISYPEDPFRAGVTRFINLPETISDLNRFYKIQKEMMNNGYARYTVTQH